jgi:sterol desaturase/sphingolipid hydroxylase (fatty acid hydroxylase superfamily)
MPAPQSPQPPKQSFFDRFRGLRWWELVLVLAPLGLLVLGGLVGGVIGAVALLANLAVARRPMSAGIKVALMVAIIFIAYTVVIVIATLIYTASHRT